jgi:colanic acid/amylovoran biosynthesis glycosyltransferase
MHFRSLRLVTQPPAQLAVLTPRWGALSETFIRRHLTEICPGQTVGITRDVVQPDSPPDVPYFALRSVWEMPHEALARALGLHRWSRRARALQRWLAERQPQAVLGEWLDFSAKWFPVLRAACPAARFVAHAHGYDVSARALQSAATLRLYRRLHQMDAIVTMSRLSKARLQSAVHLPADRIHVIPYGVAIPPPMQRAPAAVVTVLSVGRMHFKKGHLETLRAFAQARQGCPALRLEFIGDGETLPACRRFASENHLAGVVTFHGARPPAFVHDRLQAADIFALHSVTAPNGDEEGLPVSILEAMAHGLPVVATRHAGIPEAVAEGKTGFLVAEHDWQLMADRLAWLAADPQRRRAFGQAARARAAEDFSAAAEVRRLRDLLFPENPGTP